MVVVIAVSDMTLWFPGRSGSSLSSFELIFEGQNDDSVADRVGVGRGVASTFPSLDGFLLSQKEELERESSCLVSCFGASAGSAVGLSSLSSFLRINHSPDDLPWTLMVSVAVSSIVPVIVISLLPLLSHSR